LAQKRKIDYNKIKKGEQKQITSSHIEKLTDGNFPYIGGRPQADPPRYLETRWSF